MRKYKNVSVTSEITEELKEQVSEVACRLCIVDPKSVTKPSVTGYVNIIGGVSYVEVRVDYEASVASRITLTLRWSGEQDRALSQVISPLLRASRLGFDFHIKEFVSLFMTACKL